MFKFNAVNMFCKIVVEILLFHSIFGIAKNSSAITTSMGHNFKKYLTNKSFKIDLENSSRKSTF